MEAIRGRHKQVDEAICHCGIDWFGLPNPVHGEWDREALPGDDARAPTADQSRTAALARARHRPF